MTPTVPRWRGTDLFRPVPRPVAHLAFAPIGSRVAPTRRDRWAAEVFRRVRAYGAARWNARQGRWLSGTGSQKTHSPPTNDGGRRVAAKESTAPGEGRDSNQSPGSARGLDVWSGAAMSGARVCGHGASGAVRAARGVALRIAQSPGHPDSAKRLLSRRVCQWSAREGRPEWSPLTNSAAGKRIGAAGVGRAASAGQSCLWAVRHRAARTELS